jgi:hypothetical protein
MAFDGDWPGVFIRGDNAYGYITCLKGFLELHPPIEGESVLESNCRYAIKELIGLLHSSNVSPRDLSIPYLRLPTQRMRGFVDAKAQTIDLHHLTVEKLLDAYARIERTRKRVSDLWLCEAHFDDIRKFFGSGHLLELEEGEEVRCKLWGALVHVSNLTPMNSFVILGEGDAGLVSGQAPREDQLTHF